MENQIINHLYVNSRRKAFRYSLVFMLLLLLFLPIDRIFLLNKMYTIDNDSVFFKRLSFYTTLVVPFMFYFIFYLWTLKKSNVIKFMYTTECGDEVISEVEQNYASGKCCYQCKQDLNDKEPSVYVIDNYIIYYTTSSPTFNKAVIIPIKQIKEVRYEKTIHERVRSRYSIRKRTVYNLHIDTDTWGFYALSNIFISIFIKENMDGLIKCLEDNYGLTVKNYKSVNEDFE